MWEEEIMQTGSQSDRLSSDEPQCTPWHGLTFETHICYWLLDNPGRTLRGGARRRSTDLRTRKGRSPFCSYIHLYNAGRSGV